MRLRRQLLRRRHWRQVDRILIRERVHRVAKAVRVDGIGLLGAYGGAELANTLRPRSRMLLKVMKGG